jgi:hypothetical protein
MIKYQYRNPFWLYEDDRMWPKIKKQLPIILIIFLIAGVLVLIADRAERAERLERRIYATK